MPKDPNQTHMNKPKQTRKRIPRTCAQCRKRKQKCDSLKPCAVCRLRGEGHLCDYQNAQPTRVLDDDDDTPISPTELSRLRQQLDDLEALVNSAVQHRSLQASSEAPHFESPTVDLEEHNIAATLSSIMLSRAQLPTIIPDPPIVEKVRRQFRLDDSSSTHLTHAPGTLSSYFTPSASDDQISELHQRLPTFGQSQLFLKIYVSEFAWYHSCFNHHAYQVKLPKLYHQHHESETLEGEDRAAADRLIIMATTFAIARMSVMKLTLQQANQLELPSAITNRINLSKQWLDASVACLKYADFEGTPRLESIICLIVLLEALWFDERFGGLEDLSGLFELKCKAMNIAFDLALHRDPIHSDPNRVAHLDPKVAHERRVLWWALLSIDELYSGPAGRMSSINGLEAVDVYLPALSGIASPDDIHEGCESGCTASSPVMGVKPRLLMGYVGHEIARLPLRRNPMPTISDVLQAHRDLTSLEAFLPETHKLFVSGHITDRSRLPTCSRARRDAMHFYTRYHFLIVKLHRPMHIVKRDESQPSSPPFDIEYHRKFVIDHSLLLLDLRRIRNPSPDYLNANLMALSVSFSLALDYLFDPQTAEASYIKNELEQFVAFLKSSNSPLILRGLKILQCLMRTWGSPPPPGTTWFAAFEGPISPSSWVQGPFHQPLDSTFTGSATTSNLGGLGAENQSFPSVRVFQTIDLPNSPLLSPPNAQPHQSSQAWIQHQQQHHGPATQSLAIPRRSIAEQPPTSFIGSRHSIPASLAHYHPETAGQFSPPGSTANLPHHPRLPHRFSIGAHSAHEPESPHSRFFSGETSNNTQATFHSNLAMTQPGCNAHDPRTESHGHISLKHSNHGQDTRNRQHHQHHHQHEHLQNSQPERAFVAHHSNAGPSEPSYQLTPWTAAHNLNGWFATSLVYN